MPKRFYTRRLIKVQPGGVKLVEYWLERFGPVSVDLEGNGFFWWSVHREISFLDVKTWQASRVWGDLIATGYKEKIDAQAIIWNHLGTYRGLGWLEFDGTLGDLLPPLPPEQVEQMRLELRAALDGDRPEDFAVL